MQPPPTGPRYPAVATAAPLAPQRFGLLPVRSPLLGESLLLSFPGGTKMFQFPPFARHYGRAWALPHAGFPIRESPDQRLFAGSPRLIAGCHALHRRPPPRHPPSALSSLATNQAGGPSQTPRRSPPYHWAESSLTLFCCQRTPRLFPTTPAHSSPWTGQQIPLYHRLAPCSSFRGGNPPSTCKNGGGERTRTVALLRARQALSQLSYTPVTSQHYGGPSKSRTYDLTLIRRAL